ncbi:SET and MYND domain-containing protein 4-like [Chelonus insularis]|uniref:SET and MYND domain-containing protein 4-like n=1 Tax=Chelonus insularis TaxID=460826 RepID=UPI00158D7B11|nr:SET and MYND domain-containing protein 4-like [Chelonus insularis]
MGGCCVPGCSNSSKKKFIMKVIPRDPERRRKWIENIGRKNWVPSDRTYICEVHFEPDMWEKPREDGKRVLKLRAVPTIFPNRRIILNSKTTGSMNTGLTDSSIYGASSNENISGDLEFALEEELLNGEILNNEQNLDTNLESNKGSDQNLILIEIKNSSYSNAENVNLIDNTSLLNNQRNLITLNDQEKLERANKLLMNQQKLIKRYRNMIRQLKHKNETLMHNHYRKILENLFNNDQIEYLRIKLSYGKRVRSWSNETIRDALKLKDICGTRGYEELLRRQFPFPSLRSLRERREKALKDKSLENSDSDVHISYEDQQKINKFAKQNAQMDDLKEELKIKQNIMDIAKELVMQMKTKNKSHVGYGLQAECEALVGHIMKNMMKSSMPSFKIEEKNEKDSIKYREEGNQQFVSGDDLEAIESFTKSLAYADSNELMAYAHANRSAALYRKQLYRECLLDIDAALRLGYPEHKRKKLEERRMKTLQKIDESWFAKIEREKKISTDYCCKNKKNNLTDEHIKNIIDKMENENLEKPKPKYLSNPKVMELPYGPSKEAPANSDGIQISFSQKYGRHLVATKKFKPGDIVTIEKPYCWVIYRDKFYTHCHHCLERSYCLIPCPNCPIAQYCSEKCCKLNWDLAHNIECSVFSILVNLLNIDQDKFRMITKIMRLLITVTSNGKKINELREDMKIAEINPDNRTAGFTVNGTFESMNARCALSLAMNMTTRPLIGISAFACISALTAIILATQTNLFGKKYSFDELHDIDSLADIRFCGSLMLRACVITSSNCFSIQPEPGIKSGSGLFVTHSLYNHSCAPNTFRYFEGLIMITRSMEPINVGDQVFTGYGADYSYMPRNKRKEKLMEEYFFDCQCPACVNDWPTYEEILKNHVGSIKKNKKLVDQLKPYKQQLMENKFDIEAVKQVLQILHDNVEKPCEEILHAVHYLRSYYLDYEDTNLEFYL